MASPMSNAHPVSVQPTGHGFYRAFLSYSRAADGKLALALRTALQRFAKPWYRFVAIRVFRDDSSLSASPGLWSSIVRAMDQSDFFILLASPEATESEWIEREIAHWRAHKPLGRLLLIRTAGEIVWDERVSDFDRAASTAIPVALGGAYSEEPRYVDLTWARHVDHLSLSHPQFHDCIADIAATLHGVRKEDISGEEVRQHRRTLRVAWTAVAALIILLFTAVGFGIAAHRRRLEAEAQRTQTKQTLARSDFLQAAGAVGRDRYGSALALLARSIRNEPGRPETATRLYSLLTQRWVPYPLARMAHGERVSEVAFSRDGERMLSAGGRAVRVWNPRNGAQIGATIQPDSGEHLRVSHAEFSPDGRLVLVAWGNGGGENAQAFGVLGTWDATTGQARSPEVRVRGMLWTAHFDSTGKIIGTASAFNLELWDAASGKLLRTIPMPEPGDRGGFHADNTFSDFAFSANGTLLYGIHGMLSPGVLFAARTSDGRVLRTIESKYAYASIAAGGQDRLLLTGPENSMGTMGMGSVERFGFIDVIDARTFQRLGRQIQDDGSITSAMFTLDDNLLFESSTTGRANLWSVDGRGPYTPPAPHHDQGITSADVSADGMTFVTGARDGTARLWRMFGDPGQSEPLLHRASVTAVRFAPNGRSFATASINGDVCLWSAVPSTTLSLPLGTAASAKQVLVVPGEASTLLVRTDPGLELWSTRSGKRLAEAPARASDILLSPDGRVVAAMADSAVQLRRMPGLEAIGGPLQQRGAIMDARFSGDGALLVTASADGTARVWRTRDGAPVGPPLVHPGSVYAATFAGGDRVITASSSKMYVWDARRGRLVDSMENQAPSLIATLENGERKYPPRDVVDLRASASGHLLLATYGSRGVNVDSPRLRGRFVAEQVQAWSLEKRKLIGPPFDHTEYTTSAEFTPDMKYVVTTSNDRTARSWDAESGKPVSAPVEHEELVWHALIADSGRLAITYGKGSQILIWDIRSGRVGSVLRHPSAIVDAAVAADGRELVTIAGDGFLRHWDVRTGVPLSDSIPVGKTVSASFASNGGIVATVDARGLASVHWLGGPRDSTAALALAPIAERFGGVRLGEIGLEERLDHFVERRRPPKGTMTADSSQELRWLFANPESRSLAPRTDAPRVTVIRQLVREEDPGARIEAVLLEPGNPCVLASAAALMRSNDAEGLRAYGSVMERLAGGLARGDTDCGWLH